MSLVISTANVNGLRAAVRRGMGPWLAAARPDILTMQEVRAPDELVSDLLHGATSDDTSWHIAHVEAEAKGRAGVAVASRLPFVEVVTEIGPRRFKGSGRWVEATVDPAAPDRGGDRPLTVISTYVFTGDAGDDARMKEKLTFLDRAIKRMTELRDAGHHVVLTGDLNVAHAEADIKNWKGNVGKAGFHPTERARFDRLAADGWVDLGRALGGDGPGPYTWWSWRGKAYDNDAGWRIDYQIASPDLAKTAVEAVVGRAPTYAERWSDHAPLTVTYDL